jgi:hypothetical protein
MTDDEYLWQPAPGCWSVHLAASGKWEAEVADPAPEPPPVTTIAWRSWHIGSQCLGGFAELLFDTHPLALERLEWYPTASAACEALDQAWSGFLSGCRELDDDTMAIKLGPSWGPYAERNRADALLHVADEIIHHGAEVALLRDLYAATEGRLLAELDRAD